MKCMIAFTIKGWKVSLPYGENAKYDMIVDTGEKLLKVQCKSCTFKDDSIRISARSNNKKYTADQVDYFATTYKNKCYLIPFVNQKQINLRLIPPKNNQKKSIRFAHDYFIGNIV